MTGPLAALALSALCACGRPTPPGTLVGESAHFRLYVDPDVTVPSDLAGLNGLAALETEWADVQTLLHMPDGKITYRWLSPDHVLAACQEADEGGCIWEQSLEIDAPALPDAHELNHAYMYLRKQRKPIPFLAEGIAEAISCDGDPPSYPADVPWQGLVGELESASDDVSVQGGIFVRHLIRTYGMDAFLRYYEQSPEARDPAVFAANFQNFWHTSVDDVWNAIHVLPAGAVPAIAYETKICPCGLPPLDPGGAVVNDRARAPYWPLPAAAGETLALTAPFAERVLIQDCAGVRAPLSGRAVLARLEGTEPRYVLGPLATATMDAYLADSCAAAAPYPQVPVVVTTGALTIAVPAVKNSASLYINLAASFSAVLTGGVQEICGTCAFDEGSCQPLAPGPAAAAGPLYAKFAVSRIPGLPSDVVSTSIGFRP